MDFIIGHPKTQNPFDCIWVIVDRMTKLTHFLQLRTNYSSKDYAKLFIQEIIKLFDISDSIISDRGNHFSSHLWQSF